MRVVSLFSGIDGLALGLEWAGVGEVVAHVESDPYCQEVLRERFPDAVGLADVRAAGRHNLPACDVLCGGYPCQGNSVAGKRLGHDDPRSGLWREYARIVGELRPRYVVVENVPGLAQPLRERGDLIRSAPIWDVLGDLAAAGYDAVGIPLSVADCGGPHLRERVFVLAWRTDGANSQCDGWNGIHERSESGYMASDTGSRRAPLGEGRDGDHGREIQRERTRGGHGGGGVVSVAARGGRRPREKGRRAASGPGEQQQALRPDADGIAEREPQHEASTVARSGSAPSAREDAGERGTRVSETPFPNSIGSGLEGRGLPGGECPDERPARASGDTHGERARGITQPGVVRGIHGLSAWLDHGWTRSVYAPQHDWEAPRLSPKGPFTNERIKALGNSVSPVVAYVIGLILMDVDAHLRGS